MRTIKSRRFGFPVLGRTLLTAGGLAGSVLASGNAGAQVAGTTNAPLPNVLLLVDTSGSMEHNIDGTDPVCTPGTMSAPNRWGMLLQALTGNFAPYYSCDTLPRTAGSKLALQYQIARQTPYDVGYALPYNRPLTGSGANACALLPYKLPGGGGQGVGVLNQSSATGTNAKDFPDDALISVLESTAGGTPLNAATTCKFDQAADGQLDAVQDFVRFGLMTFDTDTSSDIGVTAGSTTFPTPATVTTANPFLGLWSYIPSTGTAATGMPLGCATAQPFEVGARHWAAPPWEGRMVTFPDPLGTLLDIQATNNAIQKVLLATRPYGATPIAGMLADAQDYFWGSAYGPLGSQSGYADPYVNQASPCRAQYIILLTDGAPTQEMRPACVGGTCPYPDSWTIAQDLYAGGVGAEPKKKVPTFVVGFSVNGSNQFPPNDGFPAHVPKYTCRTWFADPAGGNNDPTTMDTACTAQNPPKGSTAEACCVLNKIAKAGSGGTLGAFFADSQADLVTAFSRILGTIAKSAASRTAPAASPSSTLASGVSASFVATFIPNARKVWSGEIDRSRYQCVGTTATAQPQAVDKGDSYAVNTAVQANAQKRFFLTAFGADISGTIDSARTMRPNQGTLGAAMPIADGIAAYGGTEYGRLDEGHSLLGGLAAALGITANTCKASKRLVPGTPPTEVNVPALTAPGECATVVWDFAIAKKGLVSVAGAPGFDFNTRCTVTNIGNVGDTGSCSISGTACSISAPSCAISGEACVPQCAALGAIFRSTPNVVGPPLGVLRDQGFRSFQSLRSGRQPILYVATTDGILHAFKALARDPSNPAPAAENYELWGFVPPAVLPRLATNYPGGQQMLLDGSPVVSDVVWNRDGSSLASSTAGNDWHTTLVASLGSGGGGYYALNVSDGDCGGKTNANGCVSGSTYEEPTAGTIVGYSIGSDPQSGARKLGPHFLWQLTDVEKQPGENANLRVTRATVPGDNKTFVALFGKQTFTPAITTLQVKVGGTQRQVGVAILPGGLDGPPAKTGSCTRAGTGGTYPDSKPMILTSSYRPRDAVRQWAAGGCNDPVVGRSLTLVRLDTGEIIRHFGRKTRDTPIAIQNVTTDSPFDSPVIGTPIVYPATVGATAQKVYVGDADGTVWRLDLSDVCDLGDMSTCTWKAQLFQDVLSKDLPGASPRPSQPIVVNPVVSQGPTGTIVVNVATGDQENIVVSSDSNYLMSIEETRPNGNPSVRWFWDFTNGERVTGPMALFDRVLYFASYKPNPSATACGSAATAKIWGVDYLTPQTSGTLSDGGRYAWCASGWSNGACTGGYAQNDSGTAAAQLAIDAGTPGQISVIPGVTVRPSLACATAGALTEDIGQGITGVTPTSYSLFFTSSAPRKATSNALGTAQSARTELGISAPRVSTSIDAWAFVTN